MKIKGIPGSHGEISPFTGRICYQEHARLQRAGFTWICGITVWQQESVTPGIAPTAIWEYFLFLSRVWKPQVLHALGVGKLLILLEKRRNHLSKKILKRFQTISLLDVFNFLFTLHLKSTAQQCLNDRKQAFSHFHQSLCESGLFVPSSLGKRIIVLHAHCTSAKALRSSSLMERVSLITTHSFDIVTGTTHRFAREQLPRLHLLLQEHVPLCSSRKFLLPYMH